MVVSRAGERETLQEEVFGLGIVAQLEGDFAEVELGACYAGAIIAGEGGCMRSLQVLLCQLIVATQQEERREGANGLYQFLWPVYVIGGIERGKDDRTLLFE